MPGIHCSSLRVVKNFNPKNYIMLSAWRLASRKNAFIYNNSHLRPKYKPNPLPAQDTSDHAIWALPATLPIPRSWLNDVATQHYRLGKRLFLPKTAQHPNNYATNFPTL